MESTETTKNGFKSDKEYGYQISLSDDRPFPPGHELGFTNDDTEVTVIQKILDAFIDTTNADSISEFANYKLEFSLSVLDPFCIVLTKKIADISKELEELGTQEADIHHLMTRPYLAGTTITSTEKVAIYDKHEAILIKRRNVKDTLSALQVLLENLQKSRNFILGMNRRAYSAKSNEFKTDPVFPIKSKGELASTM